MTHETEAVVQGSAFCNLRPISIEVLKTTCKDFKSEKLQVTQKLAKCKIS